jgi:hypothetical protein
MRKLVISFVGILAIGAFMVACGDDDKPIKQDGKAVFDGGADTNGGSDLPWMLEGSTADKPPAGNCDEPSLGKVCTADTDCGGGAAPNKCLGTSDTGGVCVCDCTPDDSSTPLVNEDSCPNLSANGCGTITYTSGASGNLCFKFCKPTLGTNTCQGKIACSPRSGANVGIFDKAVCLFPGCTKDSDCPVATSTKCDPVAKTGCPAGEECLATWTGSTDGVCAKPGKCDTASSLCDVKPASLSKATAKVGDICKDDTECAANQGCFSETDLSQVCLAKDSAGACTKKLAKSGAACTKDEECCSSGCTSGKCEAGRPCGVMNRSGYCITSGCGFASSLTKFACDAGSTCNSLFSGGICFKKCDLTKAGECRGNANDLWGDYECRGWDALSLGGVAIAAVPTCEPGMTTACDVFGTSGQLSCASLGDKTNSTKMSCRTLGNKATTDKYDSSGFCFDDTASGTKVRNPLP